MRCGIWPESRCLRSRRRRRCCAGCRASHEVEFKAVADDDPGAAAVAVVHRFGASRCVLMCDRELRVLDEPGVSSYERSNETRLFSGHGAVVPSKTLGECLLCGDVAGRGCCEYQWKEDRKDWPGEFQFSPTLFLPTSGSKRRDMRHWVLLISSAGIAGGFNSGRCAGSWFFAAGQQTMLRHAIRLPQSRPK